MIQRIDNIGIAVRDVMREVRFFQEKLGLEPAWPVQKGATSAGIQCGNASLFMFKSESAGRHQKRTDQFTHNPPGIDHISLEVENIETAGAELEKRGVEFLGPIVGERGQFRYRGFPDPEGNMLYIIQTPG